MVTFVGIGIKTDCAECNGNGRVGTVRCTWCGGTGVWRVLQTLRFFFRRDHCSPMSP
jgi:DnaJ-class molecular chaperone